MLLLCIDACILIAITISLGILLQLGLEKILGLAIRSDLLGVFLGGLILSTIYFNLVSFWLPVDYWTLIPLALVSLFVYIRFRPRYRDLFFPIGRQMPVARAVPLPFFCLALLLFFYALKPPTNPDSVNYHFLSILWGEQYKAVPGLANIQEAYAFNPASFIIQSAYSFTGLTGQSLYPLNGVISALFLFWILTRVVAHRNSLTGGVYFLFLILSYRHLLGNLSSPNSDQLVQICLSYSLMRLFELLLLHEINSSAMIMPCMILLYAPVAKMSAYPALFTLFFVIFLLLKNEKRRLLWLILGTMALLIYLPWIGRNLTMSGYPVFPLPWLSPFHPDWKVPMDVMMDGYGRIQNTPKMLLEAGTVAQPGSAHFSGWFFSWIGKYFKRHLFVDLFILCSAMISPLLWVVLRIRKKQPASEVFFFWLILYSTCWLWLISAPDYRYGMPFLTLCILIPILLSATQGQEPKGSPGSGLSTVIQKILSLLFILSTAYYLHGAYSACRDYAAKKEQGFTWKEGWLFPLKDIYYKQADDRDNTPYKLLNTGIKLYLADSAHRCINAGLICTKNGDSIKIEMRGPRVEDGFRAKP